MKINTYFNFKTYFILTINVTIIINFAVTLWLCVFNLVLARLLILIAIFNVINSIKLYFPYSTLNISNFEITFQFRLLFNNNQKLPFFYPIFVTLLELPVDVSSLPGNTNAQLM